MICAFWDGGGTLLVFMMLWGHFLFQLHQVKPTYRHTFTHQTGHFFLSFFPPRTCCFKNWFERENEGDGEREMWEWINWFPLTWIPTLRSNLQLRYVPRLGIKLVRFWWMGWHSHQLSLSSQGHWTFLSEYFYFICQFSRSLPLPRKKGSLLRSIGGEPDFIWIVSDRKTWVLNWNAGERGT